MKILARIVIGLICWMVGRRDVRYRWLAHFLLGSGSRMYVQGPELEEAIKDLTWFSREELTEGVQVRTDSDGNLFWIVGTWTAQLVSTSEGQEVVRGVDRYDWHPNKPLDLAWEYGEDAEEIVPGFTWWWSPTPLPGLVGKILRIVWPACREFIDVGRYGKTAVSNGFWPFLGGTEFDTVIEFSTELICWALYEVWARREESNGWDDQGWYEECLSLDEEGE